MKTSYFFSIAIAVALLINCKGKDGAPGPAGPAGPMQTWENSNQPKEGYIKSTLSTTVEGKPETFNFDFQGSNGSGSSYVIASDTQTVIYINKSYAKDGVELNYGNANLSISVSNLSNLANAKMNDFSIYAGKELTPEKKLYISASGNVFYNSLDINSQSSFSLTDLKYNAVSKVIEGKFTATLKNVSYSSTGQAMNRTGVITNGSFSSKLFQTIMNTRKSN